MMQGKLSEQADVLGILYGSGSYLKRCLSLSLSQTECRIVTALIEQRSTVTGTASSNEITSVQHRAQSRLLRKLDNLILAYSPSTKTESRIAQTRLVYASITAAAIALRTQSYRIARHKLLVAVRNATLPDLCDAKLSALRMLRIVCARQGNRSDYNRFQKLYELAEQSSVTVRTAEELLSELIIENTKKNKRQDRLLYVANQGVRILAKIDVSTADPTVIISVCPLATAIAQVLSNQSLANAILQAYPDACKKLKLWDITHRRDWLLQQLTISEFFGITTEQIRWVDELLSLLRSGSTNWFSFSSILCQRMLITGNDSLSARIALEAITHDQFRRQRKDVQRGLLHRAGYAAAVSDNASLWMAYQTLGKNRELSLFHSNVVMLTMALRNVDLQRAHDAIDVIRTYTKTSEANKQDLKAVAQHIKRVGKMLKDLDRLSTQNQQRTATKSVHKYVQTNVLAAAVRLL